MTRSYPHNTCICVIYVCVYNRQKSIKYNIPPCVARIGCSDLNRVWDVLPMSTAKCVIDVFEWCRLCWFLLLVIKPSRTCIKNNSLIDNKWEYQSVSLCIFFFSCSCFILWVERLWIEWIEWWLLLIRCVGRWFGLASSPCNEASVSKKLEWICELLSDHGAVVTSSTNQSTNPASATNTTLATTTTTLEESNLNEMIADALICIACNHLIPAQVC